MKCFYERYKTCDLKLRQAVAVLSWGHNLLLINKIDDNGAQDINKPIGVAEYQLLLPKDELQALLIQEINSIEENIDSKEE